MSTVKNILRKIAAPIYQREKHYRELEKRVVNMEAWLRSMENRQNLFDLHTLQRRIVAIDEIYGYLELAELPGDYLEFGVSTGHTFAYAAKTLAPLSEKMRFIALDSFEGLPAPEGLDEYEGYTGGFKKTDYVCGKDDFFANMRAKDVDLARVIAVEGWFDKSLTPEMAAQNKIEKIAVAWIDCDYYESTVPVLKFITPYLSIGSVIAFDDWRCFRNQPDRGEQRACAEWLAENPHIKLRELLSFGWNGMAFTVSDQ